MFAIYEPNKDICMMKDHKKIITFDTEEEAFDFLNAFYGFALIEAMSEVPFYGFEILNEVQLSQDNVQVYELPLPEKFDNKETINFNELKAM